MPIPLALIGAGATLTNGAVILARASRAINASKKAARTASKLIEKTGSSSDKLSSLSKRLGRTFSSVEELGSYIKANPAMSGLVAIELYGLGSELYQLMAEDEELAAAVTMALGIQSPDRLSALQTDAGAMDDEIAAIQATCRRLGDDGFLQLRKAVNCDDDVVAYYFSERERARKLFR